MRRGAGSFHVHDGIEMVLHLSGRGHVQLRDDTTRRYTSPSIEVYTSGLMHRQIAHEEGDDACIVVQVDEVEWSAAPLWTYTESVSSYAWYEFLALVKEVGERTEMEQRILDLRANALLLHVFSDTTAKRVKPAQTYVDQACSYIQRNLKDIGSLSEVSDHLGVSASYLRRSFRQSLGMSIVQFITQARVRYSQDLLEHSDLTLREIAGLVGFSSEQYFSRVFVTRTGVTPGTFRGRDPRCARHRARLGPQRQA